MNFMFNFPIADHKKIKKIFIQSIKDNHHAIDYKSKNISALDYGFNYQNKVPGHVKLFYKFIWPEVSKKLTSTFYSKAKLTELWYHVYKNKDSFGWHDHEPSTFSGIYFLSLRETSPGTEFLNGYKEKIEEGTVILFPSFLIHRSPVNYSNEEKIIIAFNIDLKFDSDCKQTLEKTLPTRPL